MELIDAMLTNEKNIAKERNYPLPLCIDFLIPSSSQPPRKQDIHPPPHVRGPQSSHPRFRQGNRCLQHPHRESDRCRWVDAPHHVTIDANRPEHLHHNCLCYKMGNLINGRETHGWLDVHINKQTHTLTDICVHAHTQLQCHLQLSAGQTQGLLLRSSLRLSNQLKACKNHWR